jgi:hypothetical protein
MPDHHHLPEWTDEPPARHRFRIPPDPNPGRVPPPTAGSGAAHPTGASPVERTKRRITAAIDGDETKLRSIHAREREVFNSLRGSVSQYNLDNGQEPIKGWFRTGSSGDRIKVSDLYPKPFTDFPSWIAHNHDHPGAAQALRDASAGTRQVFALHRQEAAANTSLFELRTDQAVLAAHPGRVDDLPYDVP